ncbi:unnamed protein product [Aphanomyces euteiches]
MITTVDFTKCFCSCAGPLFSKKYLRYVCLRLNGLRAHGGAVDPTERMDPKCCVASPTAALSTRNHPSARLLSQSP